MRHSIALGGLLLGLWFLLSGLFTGLLIGCAIASCAGVVWIAARMDREDRAFPPVQIRWGRWVSYVGWLLKEIAVANFDVARRIAHPDLPISPVVIRVPTSQRTELGRVIYANSITLTPGTVSIDVDEDSIVVHALSATAAAELEAGEMDRRIAHLEAPA